VPQVLKNNRDLAKTRFPHSFAELNPLSDCPKLDFPRFLASGGTMEPPEG
jgi:hypothetical protein